MNQERGEKIQRVRGECPLLGFYAGHVGLGEGYGRRGGRSCPKPRALALSGTRTPGRDCHVPSAVHQHRFLGARRIMTVSVSVPLVPHLHRLGSSASARRGPTFLRGPPPGPTEEPNQLGMNERKEREAPRAGAALPGSPFSSRSRPRGPSAAPAREEQPGPARAHPPDPAEQRRCSGRAPRRHARPTRPAARGRRVP